MITGGTENELLADTVGSKLSLLTDSDFHKFVGDTQSIIPPEQFNRVHVRQTSYELTLGHARTLNDSGLETLRQSDSSCQELPAFMVVDNDKRWLHINPMQCCLLYTAEQLFVPPNIVGKVLARGQLFQRGLIVESTYVDPGFKPSDDGRSVHLMAFNATNRVVKLQLGMPIARLELYQIAKPVTVPHRGRSEIKRSEVEIGDFPWPTAATLHSVEVSAAKILRDKDVRLLAMDRNTLALELLGREFQKLRSDTIILRLMIYAFGGLLAYLIFLKFSVQFEAANPELKPWLDSPFTCFVAFVVFPAIYAAVKKDARQSISTLFVKPDGKS
jgi:deoxycytidine triphosphate deaminase